MEEPQLPTPKRGVVAYKQTTTGNGWRIVGFIVVAGAAYVLGALYGQSVRDMTASFIPSQDVIDLSSVQSTYNTLKDNYDGKLDTTKLIEGANRGLVEAAGDDYTTYMTRSETEEFNNSLSGDIGGGIGVEVGLRNEVPTVLRLLENNPAQKAGVMVGDIIAKVNGEEATGKSVSEVTDKIRGEEGTTVKLTLLREGETHEITVTRAVVNNPSVYSDIRGTTGVMTITRFDDQTATLARQIAREFKKENVKSVVLDLRGNGGGYVTAAQAVAGLWLEDKLVVTEKTQGTRNTELKSGRDPILQGLPTVVLVNGSSASASEIVAGALRDHKVATVLGVKTFGKGSVQKLIDLTDGAMLKVTVAKWYTPAGVNISETGIKPDKVVERTADDINANKDPQLEAALAELGQ